MLKTSLLLLSLLIAQPVWATEQVIPSRLANTTYSSGDWFGINGSLTSQPWWDRQLQDGIIAAAGNITGFYIEMDTDPGDGNSRIFNLDIATDQTVTCTVTGTAGGSAKSCSWTGTKAVSAGNVIAIETEYTGTPDATSNIYVTTVFDSTTDDTSIYYGNYGASLGSNTTDYHISGGQNAITSDWPSEVVMPMAGTFNSLYAHLHDGDDTCVPGAGESYTFEMYVDGADPGSTLSVTISDSEQDDNDTSNSVTIAAGDLVKIETTVSASAGWCGPSLGTSFLADNSGEFAFFTSGYDNSPRTSTEYRSISGPNLLWAASSTTGQKMATAMDILGMYTTSGSNPGAGKGWTFTLRVDDADSSPELSVSHINTTAASDTTQTSIADYEYLNVESVPTGTPGYLGTNYSFVATAGGAIPNSIIQGGTFQGATIYGGS